MRWNRLTRSVRPGTDGEMRAARQAEDPVTTAGAWTTGAMLFRALSRADRAPTAGLAATAVSGAIIAGTPTIHRGAVRRLTDSRSSSDSRSRTP